MVTSPLVLSWVHLGLSCQGGIEEGVVLEHPGADSFCEFSDLLFDVGEEGIRAPATDEHYCVDWILGQVHHNDQGGTYGVGTNLRA